MPVPEGVPGDADEMKSTLEEMIKNIGEQVTRIAVSKMDTTTTTLVAVIGSVLDQLAVVRCQPRPVWMPMQFVFSRRAFAQLGPTDAPRCRHTRLRRARAVWTDLAT